ncbi:hypothetical protein ACTHQF_06075 [Pedobacter sp. SAFR-022]|uniref:hypothetical protein n=1 Tax=Pedobacter sp. SAFR-022 TaxID=3436861 RepID=UPI003F80B906
MTNEERNIREAAFLRVHIFYGLHDRNDGFDSMNISYFKEAEFRIVLERCKAMGIGLYGIEPWKNGQFFDVRTPEDDADCDNPGWYFTAFEEFAALEQDLDYAASYHVADHILDMDYFPANPHYNFLKNFLEKKRRP